MAKRNKKSKQVAKEKVKTTKKTKAIVKTVELKGDAEPTKEVRLDRPIRAFVAESQVVAEGEEYERALPFYDRSSFGEIHGIKKKRMEYSFSEALYLMERGKMDVYSGRRKLDLNAFVRLASRRERNFWTRYRVYRELRTRGYNLKTALKFGADFRVYNRGIKPGQDHARWVLFVASENDALTWRQFSAMNRVAHSTRKKLLVGVVDDEGDVTFYEVRWKKP